MSRSKHQKDRLKYSQESEENLKDKIKRLQQSLYNKVVQSFQSFSSDETGRLSFSVRNIQKVKQVGVLITQEVKERSKTLLGWIFRRLLKLFGINKKYFRQVVEPKESTEERALRKLMLIYGYDIKEQKIIQGGYLSQIANTNVIANEISRYILQALSSRMTLKDFRSNFLNLFINPGKTGILQRYFSRFTKDIFMQFDRSTQVELAKEYELNHFIYAGTVMKNTRGFCEERVNRVYTVEEAEKWNDLTWKGKIPGVDFFIQCGGYNCRHTLNFITEALAKSLEKRVGAINSYH